MGTGNERKTPVDLSAVKEDVSLIVDEAEHWVKIKTPVPNRIDLVELDRCGIDLYAIPTLLKRWALVIEEQLVKGGQPEEVQGDGTGNDATLSCDHGRTAPQFQDQAVG